MKTIRVHIFCALSFCWKLVTNLIYSDNITVSLFLYSIYILYAEEELIFHFAEDEKEDSEEEETLEHSRRFRQSIL